jgi:hypothetical protein
MVVYLSYNPAIKNTIIHNTKIKLKGIRSDVKLFQRDESVSLRTSEIHNEKANMNKSPIMRKNFSFLLEIIMTIGILALSRKIENERLRADFDIIPFI